MGKIKIIKDMPDGGSVEGWEFEIYDSKNSLVYTDTTDGNGVITTGYLEPGNYKVKEIIPEGSDYYCLSENPQDVTVYAGQTATVTFTNVADPGSLEIQKTTNTGEDLGGWQFNVYRGSVSDANLVAGSPFTTEEDGKITIVDLAPGNYIVQEINDGKEYWVYDTA